MPCGMVETHLKGTRRTLSDSVSRAVSGNVGIAHDHIAERITADLEGGHVRLLLDEEAGLHDAASHSSLTAMKSSLNLTAKYAARWQASSRSLPE